MASTFTKKTKGAVPMGNSLYIQTLDCLVDTDASGQVAFDPATYVGTVFAVFPTNAVDFALGTGTITISGTVADTETVTIGTVVFEFDTNGAVTAGRQRVDISAGATRAAGTLTFTGVVADTETVVVGGVTFEFDTNNAYTADRVQVYVGSDVTATNAILQLIKAINASATCTVTAEYGTASTLIVRAKTPGAAGNTIASTETCANASWGGATLASGADASNLVAGAALLAAINACGTVLCTAEAGATANIVICTAKSPGDAGNLASTETCANAAWGGATFTGGADTLAYYGVAFDPIAKKLNFVKFSDGAAAASLKSLRFSLVVLGTR